MALVASDDPCAQLGRAAMHIRMPALFVHGDCDRLVPEVHARAIYERMPSAGDRTFHTLQGTGHMLQISHAEQIASLLLARTDRPTHPHASIEAPERASEP
jgi:pimeloyl-ACP methyl ester carboxylesterase